MQDARTRESQGWSRWWCWSVGDIARDTDWAPLERIWHCRSRISGLRQLQIIPKVAMRDRIFGQENTPDGLGTTLS